MWRFQVVLQRTASQKTSLSAVRKDKLIDVGWDKNVEQLFRKMNQAIAKASMTVYPDPGKVVMMFTDASDKFYSVVLV